MEVMLKILKTAIFDVMEKMYFILPDEENGTVQSIADGQTVYIGINGNPGYLITLIFDKELAGTMAVDLLGLDEEEVDTDTIQECLRETANIIAGSFLLGLKNEENRDVTLPHLKKEDVFAGCDTLDKRDIALSFNWLGVFAILETINTVNTVQ